MFLSVFGAERSVVSEMNFLFVFQCHHLGLCLQPLLLLYGEMYHAHLAFEMESVKLVASNRLNEII